MQIGPEMVRAWAVEIGKSWLGARVRHVEGADSWVALDLYPKGWLLFSWYKEACGCGLVSRENVNRLSSLIKRQPPIALALKSQLAGASLTGVEQLWADRILLLRFSRPVGLDISQERCLILEASPRFSNLLVTAGDLEILEMERHERPGEEGPAKNRPGVIYSPPPALEGILPGNWPQDIVPGELRSLRGIGKGLIASLMAGWVLMENPSRSLSLLYHMPGGPSLGAYLPQKVGKSLFVFPSILPGAVAITGSPLEVTGAELVSALRERGRKEAEARVEKRFAKEGRHLKNRLEGLLRQLSECELSETWRKYGEALLASTGEMREGLSEVEVSFWGPQGEEHLRIPIDSRRTWVQNAQSYFKRYRKGIDLRAKVEEEIREIERKIEVLEQDGVLAEALALCGKKIRGTPPRGRGAGKGGKKQDTEAGVQRFEIDGFTILVGTSGRGNRHVTFRLASPEDLWFHVKDLPGAHVVIRTGRREVPDALIEKVAGIAAFFSKARTSPSAIVEMTERRHVRSRQGENPGAVLYTHSTALSVKPCPPGENS